MNNMVVLSFSTATFLLIFSKILNEKKTELKEESSNFECGFDSQSNMNNQISGQFFMIALLFIVFDMEITLLVPPLMNIQINSKVIWLLMLVVTILTIGTFMEWKKGLIEWAK